MVGRLNHPNVVNVLGAVEADGVRYVVREFIDGSSLAQILSARGRLDPERAIDIIVQVGQGLEAVHRAGMVHGDVKPANILVGTSGRVLLTDFGVATRTDEMTRQSKQTAVGTPRYMSPEQAMGRPLDNRSDIYSLAAVLYEALSGTVGPATAGSVEETLARIVETPPTPISELNPAVSNGVSQVLERALAKEPSARYASVTEFVEALRRSAPSVESARLWTASFGVRRAALVASLVILVPGTSSSSSCRSSCRGSPVSRSRGVVSRPGSSAAIITT
jgi:serine/threonine-protein kinase